MIADSAYGNAGVDVKSAASSVVAYATGCAATGTEVPTASTMATAIGSCCAGPFRQFTPTMSAPASASRSAHRPGVSPS